MSETQPQPQPTRPEETQPEETKMATALSAAAPVAKLAKQVSDELAKNIVPAPELHYQEFYGLRDDIGQHPNDDVMKHIASKHYRSHDIANLLKTIAKLAFFMTVVVGLFKIPELITVILNIAQQMLLEG